MERERRLTASEQIALGARNGKINVASMRRVHISLLAKGVIAFVVPILYVALIGFVLDQERSLLRSIIKQQREMHLIEESLGRVNSTLAYAILNVSHAYSTPNARTTDNTVALDIEAIQAGLRGLKERFPLMQPWILQLDGSIAVIQANWRSGNLHELRESLNQLVIQMDIVTSEIRGRQQALSENFNHAYDSITITSVIMGLIGAAVFGGVVMLFFTRLVRDIRMLQARALEVVRGQRGVPIEATRHDELGALMRSFDNMQSVLREREAQLEVARQRRFHHEKMAAIGSLTAAIAHEVNNPIAAITGVAEEIREQQVLCACISSGGCCKPELILDQTRRISEITRQLAEMTAPHPPDPQLVDLNALVRSTCGFVRYDKRFNNVEFTFELDPQVPAIYAVADYLTQIMMNLLINAADATAGIAGRQPSIHVRTGLHEGQAVLVVADNGCGMSAETLARAFDEAFTTKPPGKGSGLGLFMCRSLIEAEGGRIEIKSEMERGTQVSVYLPRSERG